MDQNQQLEYFQDKVNGSSTCKQASDSKCCVPALENVAFSKWARGLPNQMQFWHCKTKQLALKVGSIWQLAHIPSVTEAFVKVKILKLIEDYHNVLKNYSQYLPLCQSEAFCIDCCKMLSLLPSLDYQSFSFEILLSNIKNHVHWTTEMIYEQVSVFI